MDWRAMRQCQGCGLSAEYSLNFPGIQVTAFIASIINPPIFIQYRPSDLGSHRDKTEARPMAKQFRHESHAVCAVFPTAKAKDLLNVSKNVQAASTYDWHLSRG